MAVRDGMANLIDRVRALTGAGTAEYTVAGDTYWTDQQLQDVLDSNATYFVDSPLTWLTENVDGTAVYKVAQAEYRDLEEATSGTARWVIRDGAGTAQGTANYTVDYRAGRVTWTADQGGTAYYLTGYSYDVYVAAADIWLERLAYFNNWYDFQADNQRFTRSQAWDHAKEMEQRLRQQAGKNIVAQAMGDLRVSQFVRTDINPW